MGARKYMTEYHPRCLQLPSTVTFHVCQEDPHKATHARCTHHPCVASPWPWYRILECLDCVLARGHLTLTTIIPVTRRGVTDTGEPRTSHPEAPSASWEAQGPFCRHGTLQSRRGPTPLELSCSIARTAWERNLVYCTLGEDPDGLPKQNANSRNDQCWSSRSYSR